MKQRKFRILLSVICLIIIAAAIGIRQYDKQYQLQKQQAYDELHDSLIITFDKEYTVVEYGSSYDQSRLIQSAPYGCETEDEVNTDEVGIQRLTYITYGDTEYQDHIQRTYSIDVCVKDTQFPVIEIQESSYEITEGDEFDVESHIISVKDPVDGDLVKADELSAGTYTVTTDLDTDTPGTYEVKVQAKDINGNLTETAYSVTVDKKPEPVIVSTVSSNLSSNPYYIRINRAMNTVTVYTQDDDGNYTVPYTAFVCSTGAATPTGVFTTFNKSRWRALFGNVYGQYATDIVGDILFHSVPYTAMDQGSLEYWEYNKLGTAASMGCIRLEVRNALWIYNNCPIGTVVEIYDDYSSPGPLGKPSFTYIDENDERRGWDPTDPDSSNPWQ